MRVLATTLLVASSLLPAAALLRGNGAPHTLSTYSTSARAQRDLDVASVEATNKAWSKGYRQELVNFHNTQYFGPLSVGDQYIMGIFDTGSFELVVLSTRCKTCKRRAYDHEESETYVKNGTMARLVYGSGPVTTFQGYDDVEVGPFYAGKQSFWEIVDHQIPVLDASKFDAIVGIGLTYPPNNREKTLLMSFDVNEFSICLERRSKAPGWLTWGATEGLKREDTAKVPVIGKVHWAVSMTAMRVAKKGQILPTQVCATGCAAIVDSGTSLIAAPTKALMALSPLVGMIKEDCSNLDDLPTLLFNLGDTTVALPPRAYIMKLTGATVEAKSIWDLLFFKPKMKKVNICMPAFTQMDKMSQHGDVWILGMPFFRYYHTTFDREAKELRLARATEDCGADPFKAPKELKVPTQKGDVLTKTASTHFSSSEAKMWSTARSAVAAEEVALTPFTDQLDAMTISVDNIVPPSAGLRFGPSSYSTASSKLEV